MDDSTFSQLFGDRHVQVYFGRFLLERAKNTELSPYTFSVYMTLQSFKGSPTIFPSYETIAALSAMTERQAILEVDTLVKSGFIRKQCRSEGGEDLSNLYYLTHPVLKRAQDSLEAEKETLRGKGGKRTRFILDETEIYEAIVESGDKFTKIPWGFWQRVPSIGAIPAYLGAYFYSLVNPSTRGSLTVWNKGGYKGIARDISASDNTIIKAAKTLVDAGVIKITPGNGETVTKFELLPLAELKAP